jgi:hypothetical protein
MSVTILSFRILALEGCASKWRIPKKDIICVGTTEFVKLPRSDVSTSSFARLVMGSTKVDGSITTMAGSLGLNNLIRLRNESQALHMANGDIPDALRDAGIVVEQDKPSKAMRKTRQEISDLRKEPSVVTIDVPSVTDDHGAEHNGFQIEVLRPAHVRDDVWVPLCSDTFEHLIAYLKVAGFGPDQMGRKRVVDSDQSPSDNADQSAQLDGDAYQSVQVAGEALMPVVQLAEKVDARGTLNSYFDTKRARKHDGAAA